MNSLNEINVFFESQKIAIAGVSRNKKKFGTFVYQEFKKKGIEAVPVNPNTDDIFGDPCYRNVLDIPNEIDSVLIVTNKDQTAQVVKDCLEKKVKNIWIQQMSQTPEAIEIAEEANVNLISRQCIMMFLEPAEGIHKFHGKLKKFFGKYPKMYENKSI